MYSIALNHKILRITYLPLLRECLCMLEVFVPLKLAAKNTSSASTTPSTSPLPKNVLMKSRILYLQEKFVAILISMILTIFLIE